MFLVAVKIFYHLQGTLVKILVATKILIFLNKTQLISGNTDKANKQTENHSFIIICNCHPEVSGCAFICFLVCN